MKAIKKVQTVYRSAVTGRFVSAKRAKKSPRTTVKQKIKRRNK